MRVLLLCEYVKATRWSGSAWAVDIAHGLTRRGHAVVVACDGADDPEQLPAMLRRGDATRSEHRKPFAYARWARTLITRGCQDVSLSLSPLVCANVWSPVERSAGQYLSMLLHRRTPASLFMGLTHSEWLPSAMLAEYTVTRRGVLAPIGVDASRGGLGYASALEVPHHRDDLRARARALIGVSPSRRVIAMSGVHHSNQGLPQMLQGLATLDPAPILLVLGREGYSVHARARDAGCERLVRLVGGSRRMDAALVCADIAVAPLSRTDDSSTGRFIADALRLGVPVIADADAPGVDLLKPRAFGAAPVGLIVERRDASTWAEALTRLLSDDWLGPAQRAATGVGAALSMDAFLTRLEHTLEKARHSDAMPRGPLSPATRSW